MNASGDGGSSFRLPLVNDLPGKNFGLLIAYVIPGFITLWGIRPLSPTIDGWLSSSAEFPGGIEAIAFVGLASIAAGMAVNAARWLLLDSFHAWTGLRRPIWNDATLSNHLPAFEALVDAHFRYYQHYGSSSVGIAIAFFVAIASQKIPDGLLPFWFVAFVLLESLFLVTSRDNLQHYYRRASRLLGEMERKEVNHVKRPQEAKTVEAG